MCTHVDVYVFVCACVCACVCVHVYARVYVRVRVQHTIIHTFCPWDQACVWRILAPYDQLYRVIISNDICSVGAVHLQYIVYAQYHVHILLSVCK